MRTLTALEAHGKTPSSFDGLSATGAGCDTGSGTSTTGRGSASTASTYVLPQSAESMSSFPRSAESMSSFPRSADSITKFLSSTGGSSASSGSYPRRLSASSKQPAPSQHTKFARVPSFSRIEEVIEEIPELAASESGTGRGASTAPRGTGGNRSSTMPHSPSIGSDISMYAKMSDVDSTTSGGFSTSTDGGGSTRPSYSSVQSLTFGSHRGSQSSVASVRRSSLFTASTSHANDYSQPRRSVVNLAAHYDMSSTTPSRAATLIPALTSQGPMPMTQMSSAYDTSGVPSASSQRGSLHKSSKSVLLVGHVPGKVEPIVLSRRQSEFVPLPGMVESNTLTSWKNHIPTVPETAVPVVPSRGEPSHATPSRPPVEPDTLSQQIGFTPTRPNICLTVERTQTTSSFQTPDTPCQAARRASRVSTMTR